MPDKDKKSTYEIIIAYCLAVAMRGNSSFTSADFEREIFEFGNKYYGVQYSIQTYGRKFRELREEQRQYQAKLITVKPRLLEAGMVIREKEAEGKRYLEFFVDTVDLSSPAPSLFEEIGSSKDLSDRP